MCDSAVWTAALRSNSVLSFNFSVRTEFEQSPGIIYPGVSGAAGTSRRQTELDVILAHATGCPGHSLHMSTFPA